MGDQVNQDGNQDQIGWRAALPDEWKNHDFVKTYQKPGDFVKSAFEIAQDRDGLKARLDNSIPKLTDQSTDAEKAAYYAAIGRPDKPEGYGIKKPADLPEAIPYNPEIEKQFSKFAHDKGLSKTQAEELYGWYFNMAKEGHAIESKKQADALAAATKAREDAIGKLKTEWAQDFDKNKEYSVRAFKEFAKTNPEALQLIETAKVGDVPLGDHPAFLKVFHQIGLKIFGDSATFSNDGGGGENTPEAAERKQAAMMFPSMKK